MIKLWCGRTSWLLKGTLLTKLFSSVNGLFFPALGILYTLQNVSETEYVG